MGKETCFPTQEDLKKPIQFVVFFVLLVFNYNQKHNFG
jgi:hypothetical protein